MAQRWIMLDAARRRPQAQRTVDTHGLQQSPTEAQAFPQLGRTACACDAEAQQALRSLTRHVQATSRQEVTMRPGSRDAKRGRPGPTTPPHPLADPIAGAMTAALAMRNARVAQNSGCMLATNDLDSSTLSPRQRLAGDTGQQHAERGCRFLQEPLLLASSRSRKKPPRLMALLMVMTVCWLVYAALEYRIRNALKAHQTTLPHQQGPPGQHPTARWGFQSFVSLHLLHMPGEGALVLKLKDPHRQLLRILGRRSEVFYA
jgi:hypothetical protein